MMIRRMIHGGAIAMALLLAACTKGANGDGGLNLDSAGSKIERGMDKVGAKLDTAWSDMKTGLSEAKIQALLRQLNGMDSVKVNLTRAGDVTLYGSVATETRREFAEKVAREIQGVHSVKDSITLSAAADATVRDTAAPASKAASKRK